MDKIDKFFAEGMARVVEYLPSPEFKPQSNPYSSPPTTKRKKEKGKATNTEKLVPEKWSLL
jgi:hypothetical protein